ncbi:MAG: DegT/DnrJ/EryC1/StrS family aminotransferase, partial [Romboutsia sp.]|nr:DegT/DnrJ/EryC1/StrS family aminotransferase [Romboutsia sp.]
NELNEKLKEKNIFTRKYFYPLTTDFNCYKGIFDDNIPNAKYVSDRILTLPMYGNLSEENINRVITGIKSIIYK